MVSIPTYSVDEAAKVLSGEQVNPSGSHLLDLGSKEELPMEPLSIDMDIILFPGEWYNIIPDGFMVIGLSGEKYPFKRGKSDDDIRFGCLPYGILRPTTEKI
jgi:hypothetical protein